MPQETTVVEDRDIDGERPDVSLREHHLWRNAIVALGEAVEVLQVQITEGQRF